MFLGILLISLNFIYKQGRITSDKMEMQNAADAIAYSISLTEARDLNFAAYLNRAMVANEVAIGQLLGLASWAQLVTSYGDFLNTFAKPFHPIPFGIGPGITSAVGGVAAVFQRGGGFLTKILAVLANIGTSFMHFSNLAYSYAQWGYHVATAALSFGVIDELLDKNAPPGTRISDYGWISLVSHLATFGSPTAAVAQFTKGRYGDTSALLPGGLPDEIKDQFKQFVEFHHPKFKVKATDYRNGDKGEAEAFERFAAIIRDSRDPFTLGRGWEFPPFTHLAPIIDPIPLLSVRDGNINFDLAFSFGLCDDLNICLGVDTPLGFVGVDGGVDFAINLFFGIAVIRSGASELRLLVPRTGTFEAGSIANWSSADTSSLGVSLGGSIDARVWVDLPIVGVLSVGGHAGAGLYRNPAPGELRVSPITIDIGPFNNIPILPGFSTPFPARLPFGAAFTEAGKKDVNDLKLATMTNTLVGGPVGKLPVPPTSRWAYGDAAGELLIWNNPGVPLPNMPTTVPPGLTPPISAPGPAWRSDTLSGNLYGDNATRVNKNYPGLPSFIDTSGVDQTLFGFGAPQLTISLVLKEDRHDLDRAQALTDIDSAGNHPEMGNPATALTSDGLRLTDSMADGGIGGILGSDPKLHTVARSEVYFKRPNDLDWFTRLDGREENGSAFNPYWQARLTEMPYLDSVTALMLEQGEDYTGTTELLSQVIGDIKSSFTKLTSLLDSLGFATP